MKIGKEESRDTLIDISTVLLSVARIKRNGDRRIDRESVESHGDEKTGFWKADR